VAWTETGCRRPEVGEVDHVVSARRKLEPTGLPDLTTVAPMLTRMPVIWELDSLSLEAKKIARPNESVVQTPDFAA